jgi:hypothetical protein
LHHARSGDREGQQQRGIEQGDGGVQVRGGVPVENFRADDLNQEQLGTRALDDAECRSASCL